MTQSTAVEVTEADIQSVAQKLEHFAQSLSPGEQTVVAWLLERAATGEDVQGYSSISSQGGGIQSAVLDALGFAVPR